MTARPSRLRALDLAMVACGALFLQAAFSQERRQAVGFAAALSPVARLWPDPADRQRFLKRHLDAFNTNPAFAGFILGAVSRLEERAAAGEEGAGERMARLKQGLETSLAAAGDAFLWAGLRPALALLGAAGALLAGGAGPIVFLVLYNACHLGLRVGGVFAGYREEAGVVRFARARAIRGMIPIFRWGVPLLALGLSIACLAGAKRPGPALGSIALSGVAVLLGPRLASRGTAQAAGAMIIGLALALWAAERGN